MQYLDFASFIFLHPSSWMFQNVQGSPYLLSVAPVGPSATVSQILVGKDKIWHTTLSQVDTPRLTADLLSEATCTQINEEFFSRKRAAYVDYIDCLYNACDNHRIHNTTKSIVYWKKTYCMLLLMQATLSHVPNHPLVDPAWLEGWI